MKSFLRSPVAHPEMSLQITSMADIFMIILVFLLKTYGSGLIDLVPPAGMTIPLVKTFSGLPGSGTDALKIEISKSGVSVDGHAVSAIADYRFAAGDVSSNGSSKSLSGALETQRKNQLLLVSRAGKGENSNLKVDSRIIVVADQHVPYGTIKAVLASAAVNGYTNGPNATLIRLRLNHKSARLISWWIY